MSQKIIFWAEDDPNRPGYPAGAVSSPTISTSSLPNATEDSSYSQTLSVDADGGTPASPAWTVSSGSLPTGLSLDGSTGEISGTPTTAGGATFTVQYENTDGGSDTQQLTLTVDAASAVTADYEFDWSQFPTGTGFRTPDPETLSDGAVKDFRIWANYGGTMEIISVTGQPFTRALRANHNPGNVEMTSPGDEQLECAIQVPAAYHDTEWWVEIPIRFSVGFSVQTGFKHIFFTGSTGLRYEVRIYEEDGFPQMQARHMNALIERAPAREGPGELDCDDILPISAPGTSFADGQWHTLRVHMRTGSGGTIKAWVDGYKYLDSPYDNAPGTLQEICCWGNGDPNAGTTDAGNYKVYLTDPGW